MKVHILQLGGMGNCCYIVENAGRAVIIDPSWDPDAIEKFLTQNNLTPDAVLFTHGHYDHLTDAERILRRYNIKGYIEEADVRLSGLPPALLKTYKGDYRENIAATGSIPGFDVEFMHTPGHTPGSVSIKIDGAVFTGDTLFPGVCGRTDLPGSDPRQMQKSLERLAHLPPETIVYSGHAYGPDGTGNTTIKNEIKNNPFVKMSLKNPRAFDDIV